MASFTKHSLFKYTAAPPLWMFDIIAATSASEQERRFREAKDMNRLGEMEAVDQLVVTLPKIISYYNSKMHT